MSHSKRAYLLSYLGTVNCVKNGGLNAVFDVQSWVGGFFKYIFYITHVSTKLTRRTEYEYAQALTYEGGRLSQSLWWNFGSDKFFNATYIVWAFNSFNVKNSIFVSLALRVGRHFLPSWVAKFLNIVLSVIHGCSAWTSRERMKETDAVWTKNDRKRLCKTWEKKRN